MADLKARRSTGIRRLHSKGCPAKDGRRCRCNAGWEGSVFSSRDGKKLRKTFAREAEARSWRADTQRAVDRGTLRAPAATTLREAAQAWLAGVESGEIRNRSGRPFKPSTLRGYRRDLEQKVLPELGGRKLGAVTASDLQRLVDRWQAGGESASAIRNAVKPLQAIYRRARIRDGLPLNPTHDLELPAAKAREVEIVSPAEAARLLAALPAEDRPLWATALYAGLRNGELRALRWSCVNFAAGTIEVRESWDRDTGSIDPKSRRSRRRVPMPGNLRDLLLDHRQRRGEPAEGDLVFGEGKDTAFSYDSVFRRADRAWDVDDARRALRELPDLEEGDATRLLHAAGHPLRGIAAALGVERSKVARHVAGQPKPKSRKVRRLRLHQARHTYASFMIAAGVNAKALSAFMGHSSIVVTFDLYGHLMPGTEAEAANLLSGFLDAQLAAGEQAAREADDVQDFGLTGEPTGERKRETA